jgi:hypothetical protein
VPHRVRKMQPVSVHRRTADDAQRQGIHRAV